MMTERQKKSANIIKFLFSFLLILDTALHTDHQRRYLLVGTLSLIWITAFSWSLAGHHKHLARITSNLLSFVLNAQYMVLRLGGAFTSMDMLSSLHVAGALAGSAFTYILGVLLVLIFSFIPIYDMHLRPVRGGVVMVGAIVINLALYGVIGPVYSAFGSVAVLMEDAVNQHEMNQRIASTSDKLSQNQTKYYKAVDNGYKYPGLPQKPNVVLIFTEGFSQSIVDDPRGLMPNVKQYENEESLFFENYFNHTSATYRGIPCELHSGFQFNDMDDNHLTSLQNVFDKNGYDTTLINPEPNQADFDSHLSKMGFDHYINNVNGGTPASDKDMYQKAFHLLDTDDSNGQPKLITLYTFGTHVGQNSPDKKFGDGSDPTLNKFYNMDYQFGQFMKEVKTSKEADDTLVILTTDHATYVDAAFKQAFPDAVRVHNFIDKIPMLFWYQGVKPEKIDCHDRTSLDMAPTVLDFLNMDQPSDFLGTSLFAKMPKDKYQRLVETAYVQPVSDGYWSVADGEIQPFKDDQLAYIQQVVAEYCARAQK